MVLAPRGYGGSSFRFFEALQLGVPPILLGGLDTRPFKDRLDWEKWSFFVADPADLPGLLDRVPADRLRAMGDHGARIFRESLAFGQWGDLLIRGLESLR